ncbi:neuropeptide Y receptor type 6-like isoform X1 [Montipora foliosa]|uniref:neuropeptide Y receptor type 6-like isoform X1 n=2 Tax=Montipora foliosa TaxID=591990 RepID=UPI0035F17C01
MSTYSDFDSAKIAIITVHSVLTIVNIVGNSLVCVVIMKYKLMRTSINCLLMNLAIADMVVAIFFVPRHILVHTFSHPDGVTGTSVCKLLTGGNLAWVGGTASIVTLVVIAIERYFTVVYPLGNRSNLTNGKLKVIIPSSWIFGAIFMVPTFLVKDFDKERGLCVPMWPKDWTGIAYSLSWLLVLAVFPVSLMMVLYCRVIYTLWFKRSELILRQQGVVRIRKRVTLIAITVSVIFGVCWLAQSISYVLMFHIRTHVFGNVMYVVCTTMIMVNSAINPFIYALLSQRFRKKIKEMMTCTVICVGAIYKLYPKRKSRRME